MMKEEMGAVIEKIFMNSLGAEKSERAIIFTDGAAADADAVKREELNAIFELFVETAKKLEIGVIAYNARSVGNHGAEPDRGLWQAVFGIDFIKVVEDKFGFENILKKEISLEELVRAAKTVHSPDIAIALSYFSTSHTVFRKLLNRLGCRYASMPMLEMEMFDGPLAVDFTELEMETLKLKEDIGKYKKINVTSPSGTDINIDFTNREVYADTGNLKRKGSFGNLPAGEVYVAPLEDKTSGRFVAEWAHWGKLAIPLVFYVENGKVVHMEGDKKLKSYLEDLFMKDENIRIIAEAGFGTNKGAKRPSNVLEAEKINGTCHFALGDNSNFGGVNKAAAHLDFVIFNPEIRWFFC